MLLEDLRKRRRRQWKFTGAFANFKVGGDQILAHQLNFILAIVRSPRKASRRVSKPAYHRFRARRNAITPARTCLSCKARNRNAWLCIEASRCNSCDGAESRAALESTKPGTEYGSMRSCSNSFSVDVSSVPNRLLYSHANSSWLQSLLFRSRAIREPNDSNSRSNECPEL